MEHLSAFAAVASEVVASLVSMENCGDFLIFLWAFFNELWLTKKKKKEKEKRNGHICGGIYSTEWKASRVASQCTSEAH